MLRSMLWPLLFATVFVGTQAEISHQTRNDTIRYGNISVVAIDSYLYWVTKNNTHINIHSDKSNYQECDLELNESHVGRIQVAGIEGKILLLYQDISTSLRILQLDPSLCYYVPLPSIKTREWTMDPQLVISNYSLDIFLRGSSDCLPCRLDVNGDPLEVPGQLKQINDQLIESFLLKKPAHGNISYSNLNNVFAANFKDGSSVLRRLDYNFSTLAEVHFKYHHIEAIAVNSGRGSGAWIGIIYAGPGSPQERILALYTVDFQLLFEIRLAHDPGYKFVDTMLSINSTGHSFVDSVEAGLQWLQWRRAIYDSKGQHVKTDLPLSGFDKYDWQTIETCSQGGCEGEVCTSLNSYERNFSKHYTRNVVYC